LSAAALTAFLELLGRRSFGITTAQLRGFARPTEATLTSASGDVDGDRASAGTGQSSSACSASPHPAPWPALLNSASREVISCSRSIQRLLHRRSVER
jgi:hypothetical protein